ncbi:MAG: hypothetical protein IKS17_08260 [Firmicutes bacterium]|nr:hypothetical protein [Bacillota bacterium]
MKKIILIFICLCGVILAVVLLNRNSVSDIDRVITKKYSEEDLFNFRLDTIIEYAVRPITLEEVNKKFLIEYFRENEDHNKGYSVLKSDKGGYLFCFYEKENDAYVLKDGVYFNYYVPSVEDYDEATLLNKSSYYINKMYPSTMDFTDHASHKSYITTREFKDVDVFYEYYVPQNEFLDNFFDLWRVEKIEIVDRYSEYGVLDADKKLIENKFSDKSKLNECQNISFWDYYEKRTGERSNFNIHK